MAKKTKKSNGPMFNIYGARLSNSGKRWNISLVRGKDDEREWQTLSLDPKKTEGSCIIKKVTDDEITLKIKVLKPKDDEEEEEEEEDD